MIFHLASVVLHLTIEGEVSDHTILHLMIPLLSDQVAGPQLWLLSDNYLDADSSSLEEPF